MSTTCLDPNVASFYSPIIPEHQVQLPSLLDADWDDLENEPDAADLVEFEPVSASVVPDLSATEDEFQSLKASIARHGVKYPIYVDENGEIIDGRLRKRACDELGVGCDVQVIGKIDGDLKHQLGLELDLCRKHVSPRSRKALARMRLTQCPCDSDRVIGCATGLDHKTIGRLRTELETVGEIPRLEQVQGKDGKRYRFPSIRCKSPREVTQATNLLRTLGGDAPDRELGRRLQKSLAQQHQKKLAVESASNPSFSVGDIQLLHQDFRLLTLEADSVDLIFTDLPYLEEYLPLYGDLSAFAARVLKPGGLLLAYAGSYYLPQVMQLLGSNLDWHWDFVLEHADDTQAIHARKVFCRHKLLLAYSKGKAAPLAYVDDLQRGAGSEKGLHNWQQGVNEAMYYLTHLTKPGDLIVDCCGGSFTTAEAVMRLGGRRFVGCDIDPGYVAIGQERIAAVKKELEKRCGLGRIVLWIELAELHRSAAPRLNSTAAKGMKPKTPFLKR